MTSLVPDPVAPLVIEVGTARVTRILELPPAVFDIAFIIDATTQDMRDHSDWLFPDFADEEGRAKSHFQTFVIEADGLRVLVDTCIGDGKDRQDPLFHQVRGQMLANLEQAGFPRASIDYVLCTHMHVDHVGWNTMWVDGAWVPTFPNAKYIFANAEYEYMLNVDSGDAKAILADSVAPVIDAGLAIFVEPDHVISHQIRLLPTPGHTPAHCSVVVGRGDQEAVITGDFVHHPVQLAIPHVDDNFCWNSDVARTTRRTMFAHASTHGTLLIGSHFSGPTAIRIEADGDVWKIAKD